MKDVLGLITIRMIQRQGGGGIKSAGTTGRDSMTSQISVGVTDIVLSRIKSRTMPLSSCLLTHCF